MNKSELAIGIRYLPEELSPRVLFKARGYQAERILSLAKKWGIPLQEDEILAPVLFQLPEGSWIPEEHFAVMARILAAVYTLRDNK